MDYCGRGEEPREGGGALIENTNWHAHVRLCPRSKEAEKKGEVAADSRC